MDGHFDHSDGFGDIEHRLREARPELTALELDSIKHSTMRRAMGPSALTSKGSFMKARMTILATLVVGIMMMGTGGALAVSGLSGANTAAQGEYHPIHGGGHGGILGRNLVPDCKSSTGTDCTPPPSPCSEDSGSSGSGTLGCTPPRQTVTGGKSLPFTGFLAIPVLLIGMMLLGAGVLMRRKTARDELS